MVSYGVLPNLLKNLSLDDTKLTKNSLLALTSILQQGEQDRQDYHNQNPYVVQVHESNDTNILEQLQSHSDNDVKKVVETLITKFFHTEEVQNVQ